ncbi:MAG: AMP-binding protein [Burkholderiales bacterium]|nr:AMP-binding protein [Burkholderiales bacterium]
MEVPAPAITDRLRAVAARDPGRELVADELGSRLSYGQVAEQVERVAAGLRALDIGAGDVVVVQLPNWAPFLVVHLALTAVGAVTATIPIVYRTRELTGVLALTGAKALVVPDAYRGHDYLAMAEELRAAAPSLAHVIAVGGGERDGLGAGHRAVAYDALLRTHGSVAGGGPGPDELTALGFTSGTTGALKAAMYSTRVLGAINAGLRDRYGLNEGDRVYACSPVGHAVGFTHALRMAVTIGGSLVMQDKWEPGRALEAIRRERCTYMACATPFLIDLVYHPELRRHDSMSSVRLFLCGGATIPQKLMADARVALPGTFTSPLWGMTECGGVTTCPFDAPEEKLYTTDGKPCGSMELKVVDREGRALPPGQDGELLVRGPMLTMGYYRQPELTREAWQPDGYFRTGDQARIDEDGYVRITGRIKDLIIRGGVNIAPADVEDVVFKHPRVANVAVVGYPDPRLGERICAVVVLSHGDRLDLAEVQNWMSAAGISKQKWPERVEVVDQLPMTTSGKVQKYLLRQRIAERVAAETAAAPAASSGA